MKTDDFTLLSRDRRSLEQRQAMPLSATPLAWFVCAIALVLGIGLRFANLGRQSLWFDEGYTAWAVSNPVGEIVRIIRVDTAPPLYYLLLRGWTHLFGFSESALRSMSALMSSIGLIFFALIAGKMLRHPWAVALAVMLYACSFMQIAYAHECRFYAMMSMLGAIDFYLVMLICERSSVSRLLAVTVAWSISLWTNNMMPVYLACLGVAWLVLPGRRSLIGRFIDATIVTLIAAAIFVPWIPSMLAQTKAVQAGFWASKPYRGLLYRTISVLAGVHEHSIPGFISHPLLKINLLMLAVLIAGLFSSVTRRSALALASFGFLPIFLIFAYSRVGQSIFMERAFLVSGVAMPLIVALPIVAWPKGRWIFAAIGCGFLVLSVRSLHGHRLGEHEEDWRGASAYVNNTPAAHRLVVCVSSDGEPLYRYYGCNRDYGPRSDVTAVPASFYALSPPRTMRRIKSDQDLDSLKQLLATKGFDHVVLLLSHDFWSDQPGRAIGFLQQTMRQTDAAVFTGVKVYQFKPRSGDRDVPPEKNVLPQMKTDEHR